MQGSRGCARTRRGRMTKMSRSDPPKVQAFVAEDPASREAWVFGPGWFSASRDSAGQWTSPALNVTDETFATEFDQLDGAGAIALVLEVLEAVSVMPSANPTRLHGPQATSRRNWGQALADNLNRNVVIEHFESLVRMKAERKARAQQAADRTISKAAESPSSPPSSTRAVDSE